MGLGNSGYGLGFKVKAVKGFRVLRALGFRVLRFRFRGLRV